MNINERIKIKRKELNMSQDELAKKLGYSDRSTIAKIESGVNEMTYKRLLEYAKALSTTPEYLIGWIDEHGTSKLEQLLGKISNDEKKIDVEFLEIYVQLTDKQKELLKQTAMQFLEKE